MRSRDVLTYGYEQIEEAFTRTVEGLEPDDLNRRLQPGANPVGWLAWHLLRVQDDHVADVAAREQVWTAEGWVERFGLDLDPAATGYGFDGAAVDRVRIPSVDLLLGYSDAVHARSVEFLRGISADDLQHVGQAAYVRGLLDSD